MRRSIPTPKRKNGFNKYFLRLSILSGFLYIRKTGIQLKYFQSPYSKLNFAFSYVKNITRKIYNVIFIMIEHPHIHIGVKAPTTL